MTYAKANLFGIDFSLVDYPSASDIIISHASSHHSFGVSALAVHGLVTAVRDRRIGNLVRKIDMVVPDGQPVRWALNSFYDCDLKDRVYGPQLTLEVLHKASDRHLNVFLFGSTRQTLQNFSRFINEHFPDIHLCGIHVDRFRDATTAEDRADIERINASNAHIVLVGRGCPRQEVWVAEHLGAVRAVMMAIGAAFDFHAGTKEQAPPFLQRHGLEWLFRLLHEPRRLWKRYLTTNLYFIFLFAKHKFFLRRATL